MDKVAFGETLYERRMALQKSQRACASLLGFDSSYWSKIEHGKCRVSDILQKKMLDAIETAPSNGCKTMGGWKRSIPKPPTPADALQETLRALGFFSADTLRFISKFSELIEQQKSLHSIVTFIVDAGQGDRQIVAVMANHYATAMNNSSQATVTSVTQAAE